ncbi:MAG: GAF domain-containing protein [Chloroflexi bacterium]|nr:GAF domain-containing protein [Chloroflexota bacterium]
MAAIQQWWRRLTEPAAQIEGLEQRSQAQLLASMALALMLFAMLRLVLGIFLTPVGRLGQTGTLVGLGITLLVYVLSRTRWYGRWTQWLLLGLTFVYPLVLLEAQTVGLSVALSWMALAILCTALFLAARDVLWVGAAAVGVSLTLPLFWNHPFELLIAPAIFLAAVTLFVYLLQNHRQRLEVERQALLKDSEEQLLLALNAAQMGTWRWQIQRNQIDWSPRTYELLGLPLGTVVDFEAYQKHVYPPDWPLVAQAINDVVTGVEHNYYIEHRVAMGDGSLHWLEAHGRLFRDARGNPFQLTGTVRDITERKEAEIRVRNSEEKFYKAFHITSAAVVINHAESGAILEVNEAFYRISGLMADQVLGRRIEETNHWRDRAQQRKAIEILRTTGKLRNFPMTFYHQDGTEGQGLLAAEVIEINNEPHYLSVMLDVTEQRQSEAMLARRAQELTALHQTTLELNGELELSALLRLIIHRACQLIGTDYGTMFMLTPDQQALEIVALCNYPEELHLGNRLKKDQGLAGQVFTTGKPLAVSDYKNWAGRMGNTTVQNMGRAMAVPLCQGEKVVGSLNVSDDVVGEFASNSMQLLEMFAAYASVVIANAQLFAAEQRQRQTAETLREIGRLVGASLELHDVLEVMLEQIERVIPYDSAHFMLIDDQQNTHMVAARRYFRQEEMLGTIIPLAKLHFSSVAIATNKPVVIGDTHELPNFNPVPEEARAIRSMMLIPIVSAARPLGVLSVLSLQPHQFGTRDQFVAEQFAQQVVMAVENARLHEALKQANTSLEQRVNERTAELARANALTEQRLEQLAALNSITQSVSRATDLRTALLSMTQSLTPLLRASFSLVAFFNEERTEIIIMPRLNLPNNSTFSQLASIPAVREVLHTRTSLIIGTADAAKLGHFANYFETLTIAQLLLIPLIVRGQMMGIIAVVGVDPDQPFSRADIQLGETVAGQVAGIIEQFRLLEREYEARVAAEAANRAKSTFLASMSHELRTPLNSILGFTQVLRLNPKLEGEEREQLGIVQASGEHLLKLINEVLDMSKIEAGQMSLQVAPFVLERLLNHLRAIFHSRAMAKGLAFRLTAASTLPRSVVTDERRLTQILMNLLENALKFTSTGQVTLEVTAETTPVNTILHFAVTDTGIGIREDELPLLFTRFSQTSSGRQSQQGTGLGLALSQQLVHLLGGEIGVESVLGQGTRFYFSIPVEQALLLSEEEGETAERVVVGLAPNQPDYRVLIVEDLPENALLLQKVLEPLRLPLKIAENGQEGVAVWESWRPHLILMDMQMPIMDGYEATRRIKALADGDEGPRIIALTASVYESERAVILANGCDDFLSKPFRTDELLAMLSKHLGLEYVYEMPADPAVKPAALLAENLRELPTAWRARMSTAAIAADQGQMSQLVAEIAADFPTQAIGIQKLIGRYATFELLELLEESA